MEKKFCVYKHTFPNQKIYIGVTCRKPEYRWDNGNGYSKSQRKMYNAIKKYGWENIKHEILFENLTKEEAASKEIELINFYQSTNDKYGYNIEKGGNLNKEITDETRSLMIKHHKGRTGLKLNERQCKTIGLYTKKRWEAKSQEEKQKEIDRLNSIGFKKGESPWNKGKNFNEEAKLNMSMAQKKRYENGAISPMKGKKHTEEAKKKMSEKRIGVKPSENTRIKMKENNANAKKIIIIETGQIFNSGKECAEYLGCHRCSPNFACNGVQKTCKGYHMMWLDEYYQRNSLASNKLADIMF